MQRKKISKEKAVMAVTIGIACFALMLVMFMQFKVVRQIDITSIENMREEELRSELLEWRSKYNEVKERYDEISIKIEEYQTEKESDEKTAELLQKELDQLELALGTTEVEGEGITIILTDNGTENYSEEDSVNSITDSDLLIIVRELFNAGAEAISINGNRIVSMTDIFLRSSDKSKIMQIDSKRITSPYVIKAIGNKSYLESAAKSKDGRLSILQEAGHTVEIQVTNRPISIEAYTGTIDTKYMKDKE